MKGWITFGVILLCILLVLAGIIRYAKSRIRNFSRQMFGTDSLTEGWKRQEEELSMTPASVSGMTRILEPQIQKDFPEFNWVQFRNKAEEALRLSMLAIASGSVEKMERMAKESEIS